MDNSSSRARLRKSTRTTVTQAVLSYCPRTLRRRLADLVVVVTTCFIVHQLLYLLGLTRRTDVSSRRTRYKLPACQRVGRVDDETPISAHHVYSTDGLLHVNPDGIHPILAFIRSAEDEWDRKLDRASRTLEDAVKEYKRRYRRDPPVGFDDWWDFAQEMEDQLPDEYDSIHRALEPFWGIDPLDLARIQATQETRPDTFTLAKNATHDTNLIWTSFSNPERWEENRLLHGYDEIRKFLDPVEPALRPFRAVFSPHPEPSLMSDYHVRKAFLDAAAARKYINISDIPDAQNLGFTSACAPGSPGRPQNISLKPAPAPSASHGQRTFIYNHRLSMDPCHNPHLITQHAHYVSKNHTVTPQPTLAAQFSFSSTPLYHDIPLPSLFADFADEPTDDDALAWENKTDERLFWRGSNIGMVNGPETRWIDAHRSRLIAWANDLNGTANLLLPGSVEDEGWQRAGAGTLLKKALVNPMLLDVAFSGRPVGCDIQFCRHMETMFEWREQRDTHEEEVERHKYVLDVDGKGPSADFRKLMASNSLVFKATAFPEWWLDRSQPWVHYVPVQVDHSDLHDTLLFFRGGLYGEDDHDELAKRIAYADDTGSRGDCRHRKDIPRVDNEGNNSLYQAIHSSFPVMSPPTVSQPPSTGRVSVLVAIITNATKAIEDHYSKFSPESPIPSLDDLNRHPLDSELAPPELRNAIKLLQAACEQLSVTVTPPGQTILNRTLQNTEYSCLGVVLAFKVVDILNEKPTGMHVTELGQKIGIDARKLGRILLDGPMALLRETLADPVWGNSEATEHSPWNKYSGYNESLFKWFEQPEAAAARTQFGIGVAGWNEAVQASSVVTDFPWDTFPPGTTICDVGGGVGNMSMALAKAYPSFRFKLQDLPNVINLAETQVWPKDYPAAIAEKRIEFKAMDFFVESPIQGCDVYYLKGITHDWPDTQCIQILRNVRSALKANSRVLIQEYVLQYANRTHTTESAFQEAPEPMLPNYGVGKIREYAIDIHLMVTLNSRERTLEEFISMAAKAGLNFLKLWPAGEMSVIEFMNGNE
ncbi:hypothetical protein H0H92_001866 [Tricholoma furcatifolium]|nr:hypothetical protein H0H92_001866 [Tricholoma furcatifolium]